jgi:hypothetical protein
MDLVNYLISMLLVGIAFQLDQTWIAVGIVIILIVASKDVKASIFMAFSVFVLYWVMGIGMNDYWLFAMLGLVAIGYVIGLGKEEAGGGAEGMPMDPYGGMGGGYGGLGGLGM